GGTVVMSQDIEKDANFTFNRSWVEYRDGFYHGKNNIWAGLEVINLLTTRRFHNKFQISAIIFDPIAVIKQKKFLRTTFTGFKVDHENTQFLMTYDFIEISTEYHLGEMLRTLNNSRFSTYDRDNDHMAINCAMKYGGGWWYNNAG
ncbi:hypothetical protein LOTGIDRAFT_96849, partial [Lottia gigantea]